MATRQEEKERRRLERQAREAAERQSAQRKRRTQWTIGGLLAVGALIGIAFAVFSALSGGDEGEPAQASSQARLPAPRITDLDQAAEAAGCRVTHPRYEGNGHADREFRPRDYRTNPPTSGAHNPQWYEDGVYEPGTLPRLGEIVHTLEHGRINVQYRPGTPAATVSRLEALLQEANDGYHMLLYENTTRMRPAVAATAWTQSLTCPQMNDRVFDAIRAFRTRYIDRGPERVQ